MDGGSLRLWDGTWYSQRDNPVAQQESTTMRSNTNHGPTATLMTHGQCHSNIGQQQRAHHPDGSGASTHNMSDIGTNASIAMDHPNI
jgi:hypothetical protein